jgi:hypothetical protein
MASLIDSEKLAAKIGAGFQFGTGVDVAGELRKLAAAIEASDVAVQKVTLYHTANVEDFKMTGLVLLWAEKVEAERQARAYLAKHSPPFEKSSESAG